MEIRRRDLMQAAEDGVMPPDTAEALWAYLDRRQTGPRFRAAHILYYLGGFVAMAALGLFIGQAWDAWAGWPMLLLAGGFALLGLALTRRFLDHGLTIPAGVTLTFAREGLHECHTALRTLSRADARRSSAAEG